MEQLYFEEIFQYPIKEFKYHLERASNERIIFSGRFGTGKTKFLEDFFAENNQTALYGERKYETYRLCPVNYSIASNEDIIRYIKYDIIIEMLKKSLDLEQVQLNMLDTLPEYLKKNWHKVIAAIVFMIPKVGKEIVECFDRSDKLKDDFLKYHDQVSESPSDKMIKYIEQLEVKEGSIYENDITTRIISEAISQNAGKESILIIDDVDRLDPEHVFRILNVFASHFESNTSAGTVNKFNFSRIIIVCDINNIRNIFHHRYGAEVDFMGYIDKFYSSDIYYFDNKKALNGVIQNIFESIDIETKDHDNMSILAQFYFKNEFLIDLANLTISQSFINLRNILKLHKKIIGYHYEQIYFDSRNSKVNAWINPIVMQLRLLRDLLGDYRNMKKVLELVVLNEDFLEKHEFRFGELLYILGSSIHNYYKRDEYLFDFHETHLIVEVKRRMQNDQFEYAYVHHYTGSTKNDKPEKGARFQADEKAFKQALLDSIDLLHKTGYLK